MTIEQIRSRASDCRSIIRCAEFVSPAHRPQTVIIIGIGAKYVRIMFQDGSTQLVEPSFPMFFTCVW